MFSYAQTSIQFPYGFRLTQKEMNIGNYCPGGSESPWIPIVAKVNSKDLVLRGLASSPLGVTFSLTKELKDISLPYKLPENVSLQLPYEFTIYVQIPLLKEGPFTRTITITTNESGDNTHQLVIKGDYLKRRCQ
jgi:hypothetical protein